MQPSKTTVTSCEVQLFSDFGEVATSSAVPETLDFYRLLQRLRESVRVGNAGWAKDQTVIDYASICFWAIRKLEYGFATRAIAEIETEFGGPIDVLDVGCGVVPLCNWMSLRGQRVTAIDPSAHDISLLVDNDLNGFYGSSVEYRLMESERLRLPDASFDVVTCISVMEHLPSGNDRLALWDMARVLKPGGRLILTFDVAPPAESDEPSGIRQYEQSFHPAATRRLLQAAARAYDTNADEVAALVGTLNWEDVRRFWRAAQQHDDRPGGLRDYLACGVVLQRLPEAAPVAPAEIEEALWEGQSVLTSRLNFYKYHAEARQRLLERIEDSNRRRRAIIELRHLAKTASNTLKQLRARRH